MNELFFVSMPCNTSNDAVSVQSAVVFSGSVYFRTGLLRQSMKYLRGGPPDVGHRLCKKYT